MSKLMTESTKAKPKIVFLDTEFTGEHMGTTLVSLAMVTLEGEEFYVSVNDYDRNQVTDWLQENVLEYIDESQSTSSIEAYRNISAWLENYSDGDRIFIVSAGLAQDILLLYELFRFVTPEQQFHALHCLPKYLKHHAAIDLNTLFRICGVMPDVNRADFAGMNEENMRHIAIDDARVVRGCFLKLEKTGRLDQLLETMID